jgi:hypothetical protein
MDANHVEMKDLKPLVEQYGRGASVFCWYQGESDAAPERAKVYGERLKAMAAAMRRYSGNPDMTMVIMQLSTLITFPNPPTPAFGRIREAQRRFCAEDPRAILIPTLPYDHLDPIHLSEAGVRELAGRISQALDETAKAKRPVWQGPRVASLRFTDDTRRRIEIKYDSAKRLVLTTDPNETGDPMEKWKAQWFVTDERHLGFASVTTPELKDGEITLQVSGALMQSAKIAADGRTLRVRLTDTGYITPMEVIVDGLTLTLETTQAALPGAKLSFALMDDSMGYMTDERGKPAAAFADMPIDEP